MSAISSSPEPQRAALERKLLAFGLVVSHPLPPTNAQKPFVVALLVRRSLRSPGASTSLT